MITASLAGVLAALIAARAMRWARPSPRRRSSAHASGHRAVGATADYASILDAVARRVRSGSSLTTGIVEEAGECAALRSVIDRLAAGGSLAEALDSIDADDADLALTIQALSATAHLGGPIGATLDEAAAVLRQRVAARAERRAHSSQARLSARVLTIVPLAFAAWNAVTSRQARDVYLSNAVGGSCAVVGLALNVAGWRWMKKIVGPA